MNWIAGVVGGAGPDAAFAAIATALATQIALPAPPGNPVACLVGCKHRLGAFLAIRPKALPDAGSILFCMGLGSHVEGLD